LVDVKPIGAEAHIDSSIGPSIDSVGLERAAHVFALPELNV